MRSVVSKSVIAPPRSGRDSTMLAGVRPIICQASEPIASTSLVRSLIAMTVGSRSVVSGAADGSTRSIWCESPARIDTRHDGGTSTGAAVLAGLERLGATRMRQYVRAWINEWDLVRLDPHYRPDIETVDVVSDYREDDALEEDDVPGGILTADPHPAERSWGDSST